MHIVTKEIKTPIGQLVLGDYNDKICLCDWKYRKQRQAIDDRIKSYLCAEFIAGTTSILEKCEDEITHYFNKGLSQFTIPLCFTGTVFQKQIWNELLKIPFGTTTSYLQLAKNINNVAAIRAVAAANGANAISIIVPCHRVIGSNGNLIGYAGGLNAKKELLKLEMPEQQTYLDFK